MMFDQARPLHLLRPDTGTSGGDAPANGNGVAADAAISGDAPSLPPRPSIIDEAVIASPVNGTSAPHGGVEHTAEEPITALTVRGTTFSAELSLALRSAGATDNRTLVFMEKLISSGEMDEARACGIIAIAQATGNKPLNLVKFAQRNDLQVSETRELVETAAHYKTTHHHIVLWAKNYLDGKGALEVWKDAPPERRKEVISDVEDLMSHWKEVRDVHEDVSFKRYLEIYQLRGNLQDVKDLIEGITDAPLRDEEHDYEYPYATRIRAAIRRLERNPQMDIELVIGQVTEGRDSYRPALESDQHEANESMAREVAKRGRF